MNNSEQTTPPNSLPTMTLLERREIEASIAGAILDGFIAKFGEPACLEVLAEVISRLAHESGEEMARTLGENDLKSFTTTLDKWKAGNALELNILEQTDDKLSFNVTRCRYAEMYRRLGLEHLGKTLSCLRDFELAKGFNPDLVLERSQTIMEGAEYCDFRFRLDKQ